MFDELSDVIEKVYRFVRPNMHCFLFGEFGVKYRGLKDYISFIPTISEKQNHILDTCMCTVIYK